MKEAIGKQEFISTSAAFVRDHLNLNTPDVTASIKQATGAQSDDEAEKHRTRFLKDFSDISSQAKDEPAQPYVHYASRIDIVGLYQSVLSKIFSDVPGFQGYGDKNAIWVTTLLEKGAYELKNFFHSVHELHSGGQKTILAAVLEAWKDIKFERAPYPSGIPSTIPFPDKCTVALLADWGGDNPAAKQVAKMVVDRRTPEIVIHLGDIYYGGVEEECRAFLRNWPIQLDSAHPGNGIPKATSFALNGNHEMYSGGESFFKVVLPAFAQPQPFFCLENTHWRLIGLDTAYNGGRLKPNDDADPIAAQWKWLIGILKSGSEKKNIFLTHHQPVSAHAQEFSDSMPLRADIEDLLDTEGIPADAIFGWFFGHEHRTTVYENEAGGLHYNARLIGSGCIPHEIQTETKADEGCTPFQWVSGRSEDGGTTDATSLYAELLFDGDFLLVNYKDERGTSLGHEGWYASRGRLKGDPFVADKTTYFAS